MQSSGGPATPINSAKTNSTGENTPLDFENSALKAAIIALLKF